MLDLGYMAGPAPGALFDRSSVSWRVVSTWPVLAGGPAALLLQVGHPSVAAGVAQFSSYATDPFGRLERTLEAMLAISFGTPERREQVLADLRGVHRGVAGTRPDGVEYRSLDPELQCWVWATLAAVALEVERRYLGVLSRSEREEYYLEATELARCFRVPDRLIPEDLAGFRSYVADMSAGLVVTEEAKAVAASLFHPPLWWAPRPAMLPLEWVTVDLLGRDLSDRYGLPRLTAPQRRVLHGARWVSRSVLPRLPGPLLANPLNRRAIAAA